LICTVLVGLLGLIWALVMERVRDLENWRNELDLNIPSRVEKLEVWRDEVDMEFWPLRSKVESLQRGIERLEIRRY
jgi:hypothetical protein